MLLLCVPMNNSRMFVSKRMLLGTHGGCLIDVRVE